MKTTKPAAVPTTHAAKLQNALEFLGPRWLLHKRNAVKRLTTPYGSRT